MQEDSINQLVKSVVKDLQQEMVSPEFLAVVRTRALSLLADRLAQLVADRVRQLSRNSPQDPP
jgi:ribosome maturation factor RimP